MKSKLFTAYAALAIFSAAGCTDLSVDIIDSLPISAYPENETQVAAIPIESYKCLTNLIDDGGGWYLIQELTSDELCPPTRDKDWDDGGKWRVLYQHTWTKDIEAINNMWSNLYKGVTTCNTALDLLADLEQNDATLLATAKVKVLRALYYYMLIDNYGDVPYVTSIKDADATPYRNKRADIWKAIVSDLEANYQYLPVEGLNTSVTRGAAFALLSKLYLNAQVYTGTAYYDKADNYCDSIIKLGRYSFANKTTDCFVTENENCKENIFTIGFDENLAKGFRIHMRSLHYESGVTFDMSASPWNGFAVPEDFFNTFEDKDIRKGNGYTPGDGYFLYGQQYDASGTKITTAEGDLILTPNIPELKMSASSYTKVVYQMSGVRTQKYYPGKLENLSNDFVMFRLADTYLTKAECLVRQGKNGDDYINPIRKRAGLDELTNATLDQIYQERGKELFMKGYRRQDMIRFNTFTQKYWQKEDAGSLVFPVPQWAIDANANLKGDVKSL